MKPILYPALAIIFLTFACISLADSHHQSPKSFNVTEFKPGFHLLQGKGGNILVSEGDDGLFVVDADYLEMSEALIKTLDSFKKELKFLVNTHWHGDHTQGNKELGKFTNIVAHDNVYKRLNSRQEVKLFNMVSEPYPSYALPDVTFENQVNLYFNSDKIKVVHFPKGHTDGDSIVFFENENIVHLGDHFFNGFFPFVDLGSGGDVRGVSKNISEVLSLINEETVIIPGHGPIASKDDLQAYKDMIDGTVEEIQAMKENGLSKSDAEKQGLSPKWDPWTKGFLSERVWIGIVYESL